MWYSNNEYPRYLPVAARRAMAERQMKKLREQGYDIEPIESFRGNKIAKSFWGHAWCRHLESFSDYDNRLPRGRAYARNGSVCHLGISSGRIEAFVCGSELYEIAIRIDTLPADKWESLKKQCAGKIGTLLELLHGKLSDEIMRLVTDKAGGLFPSPKEIHLDCNCPDYADLCKHLAAVLYGVGVRLDTRPDLLFLLRGVDHHELIQTDLAQALSEKPSSSKRRRIASTDLSDVFGVEIDTETSPAPAASEHSIQVPPVVPVADTSPRESPAKRPAIRAKKTASQKASRKRVAKTKSAKLKPSPKTGDAILKLRRKFDMTEWEFGLMVGVSTATVRSWESNGKARHNAQPKNQQELDTVAQLSKAAAWDRLDEYL